VLLTCVTLGLASPVWRGGELRGGFSGAQLAGSVVVRGSRGSLTGLKTLSDLLSDKTLSRSSSAMMSLLTRENLEVKLIR
jgi:hypothetical protein